MLKLSISLFALLAATSSHAQEVSRVAISGLDDEGHCVSPCRRAGGRPCNPCMPRLEKPGSSEWDEALGEWHRNNHEFGAAVREHAMNDSAYRKSPEFKVDSKVYRDTEAAVARLDTLGTTMSRGD